MNTRNINDSDPIDSDQLLSVALAAFMGGKKLRVYSHQCASYGWHGGTYNELTGAGSMYLHH
jgi:hypothetical protein